MKSARIFVVDNPRRQCAIVAFDRDVWQDGAANPDLIDAASRPSPPFAPLGTPLASAAAFASTARLARHRCSIVMGLALLVLGLILFLGPHVFVTMRDQRDMVVKRMGEWPYKA